MASRNVLIFCYRSCFSSNDRQCYFHGFREESSIGGLYCWLLLVLPFFPIAPHSVGNHLQNNISLKCVSCEVSVTRSLLYEKCCKTNQIKYLAMHISKSWKGLLRWRYSRFMVYCHDVGLRLKTCCLFVY